MITFPQILLIISAYFLGAIPFAYIIVKLVKNIDIRTVGSGNAGATNAARVLGKWGFISVFLLDALKGFLPVFISHHYYGQSLVTLIVALVVILGHTYTIFLSFKGGKGVATGAGVFLALAPIEIGIALTVFLIVFFISKMVSLGSILGSLALFISVLIVSNWFLLKILAGIVAFFIIFKHRQNIIRIIKGEESKFVKEQKEELKNDK